MQVFCKLTGYPMLRFSSISNFQAQSFPQIWGPCGNEAWNQPERSPKSKNLGTRSTKVPLRSQSPQHGDASSECHTPWVHMADLRKLDAFQARNCLCSVLGISDYDKCTEILCEILFHTLHMLMLIAQVYELQLKHGASEWVPFG